MNAQDAKALLEIDRLGLPEVPYHVPVARPKATDRFQRYNGGF